MRPGGQRGDLLDSSFTITQGLPAAMSATVGVVEPCIGALFGYLSSILINVQFLIA
jgi:hypothetical protein